MDWSPITFVCGSWVISCELTYLKRILYRLEEEKCASKAKGFLCYEARVEVDLLLRLDWCALSVGDKSLNWHRTTSYVA